jgi:hypothetical protein
MSDRYDAAIMKLQNEVKQKDEAFVAQRTKVATMILDDTINKIISETGVVRQGAMLDIQNRARATFRVNDRDELETDATDEKMNPLTPQSWAKKLVADAPYLFEVSGGGGAGGGQRKGGSNGTQRVISDDPTDFGRNLEAIAAGRTTTQSAVK